LIGLYIINECGKPNHKHPKLGDVEKTPTFGNIGDGLLLGLPRFPGITKYYRIWIMWKNGELDGISKLPGINVDFKLGIFILSVILWGCNYKKMPEMRI
jgi:hypothetical protein